MESLFKFIPKELFPSEYGGDAGSMDEITVEWEKKFKEFESYFEEDDQYKTIESKRVKPLLKAPETSTYGFQGSFRQLNVD